MYGFDNGSSPDEQGGDLHDNTAAFFTCNFQFSEIVCYNLPKEKVCMGYYDYNISTKRVQCQTLSDFNIHSMHMRDVLLECYDTGAYIYPCTQLPTGKPLPSTPGPPHVTTPSAGPPKTPSRGSRTTQMQPKTTPVCDEDVYQSGYFYCGLNFALNMDTVSPGAGSKYECHMCSIVKKHQGCLATVRKASHCDDYELGSKVVLDCVNQEAWSIRGMRCPKENCKRKTETVMIAVTLVYPVTTAESFHVRPVASQGVQSSPSRHHEMRAHEGASFPFSKPGKFVRAHRSPCRYRFYVAFRSCIQVLAQCYSLSDLQSYLAHFTAVLMDGYAELCKHHNVTGKSLTK
ncbi:hypothetical protein HPB51_027890 [Rhipicephalus microplus]|uniref:Uncharacterized protein n=1 Tax=Rhipicephalus microplus TaxID=6941 RepID=A0A9J6CZ05_RHIMP|nr:hypothetical protein HPB51_027890 [Rhipicephalus microplus]